MKIKLEHIGDFSPLEKLLNKIKRQEYLNILNKYGREGVQALAAATPVDSGTTASSWNYEIVKTDSQTELIWTNSNINQGHNIAILLQYGHGTGTGGYVMGTDYINPALALIFDKMAKELWKEVSAL